MSMESLKLAIIDEMQSGYRPTYRGHAWAQAQYDDLEAAGRVIEVAFHLLKGVQFPEMRASRARDSLIEIRGYFNEPRTDQHHDNEQHPPLQAGDTLG